MTRMEQEVLNSLSMALREYDTLTHVEGSFMPEAFTFHVNQARAMVLARVGRREEPDFLEPKDLSADEWLADQASGRMKP